MRLYRYVGPKYLVDRSFAGPSGVPIHSPDNVRAWVADTSPERVGGCVVATFVVDSAGDLRLADRRSEHVACAAGQPVRSAGEITFAVGSTVEVVEVSNQSTGYCPEPESWPAVAEALSGAGLRAPAGFSPACDFRRCVACGSVNLVKGGEFECAVCGQSLPTAYNVQPGS